VFRKLVGKFVTPDMSRQAELNILAAGAPVSDDVFKKLAGRFVKPDIPRKVALYIFAPGAPLKSGIGFVVNATIAFAFKNISMYALAVAGVLLNDPSVWHVYVFVLNVPEKRAWYVLDEFVHDPRNDTYELAAASVIVLDVYPRHTPSPGSYCAAFVTEGVIPRTRFVGKTPVRNRIVKSFVTTVEPAAVTVDVVACRRIAFVVQGITAACTAAATASPHATPIIHRLIMESPLARRHLSRTTQ
jgi:hypothetical protein